MKGKLHSIARHFLGAVLIGGSLFTLFKYLADFQLRQSVLLTVIAYLVFLRFVVFQKEEHPEFAPYRVHISLNWDAILKSLDVDPSDEEWTSLLKKSDTSSEHECNVLRDGVLFTVLNPKLTYWDSEKVFKTLGCWGIGELKGSERELVVIGFDEIYRICIRSHYLTNRWPESKNSLLGMFWVGEIPRSKGDEFIRHLKLLDDNLTCREFREQSRVVGEDAFLVQQGWKKLSPAGYRLKQPYFSTDVRFDVCKLESWPPPGCGCMESLE